MQYRRIPRYKYQLLATESVETLISGFRIATRFIALDPAGRLTVAAEYAWDGPSGPTVDTRTFMRASLFHDALYQLILEGHLPPSARAPADLLMRRICLEDGMWPARAWNAWAWVRLLGRRAARPKGRDQDA